MNTITIPKKLASRDDLVVIPRKQYESLVKIAEKKSLDFHLQKSLDEWRAGKYYGPFETVEEAKRALGARQTKRRR